MPLTYTTKPTPPKAEPQTDTNDIIVNGKVVGQIKCDESHGSTFHHAHLVFNGLGMYGLTEVMSGHGSTPEAAIEDAISSGLKRIAVLNAAVYNLAADIGFGS